MGRILGIDYGTRRIGVAISDPTRQIASPYAVWPAEPRGKLLEELRALCIRQQVVRIVLGRPVRTNGTEGPEVLRVREFANWLRAELGLDVEEWDERWTTVTAERALIEGGMRRQKRKECRDAVAAQVMLQHYLDAQAHARPDAPLGSTALDE